jgi:hypothetical protein
MTTSRHDTLPIALRHFILAGPKALGQRHLDLVFARPSFGFVARTAQLELAGRAPTELNASDFSFFPGLDPTNESDLTASCGTAETWVATST